MRRLSSPALFSLILSSATAFSAPAFAADQNTYRAGKTYLKTVANHYSQCERQCAGDAECRSWNFVRPNAGAASGICEFNSRASTPVQSSSSMSGTMNTRIDPALSRAVQGGTNTIKIGTPPMATPKMATRQRTRTVVRQPVPRQINASQARHTRPVNIKPTPRQPQNAPKIYGAIKQPIAPTRQRPVAQQPPKPATQGNQGLTAEQAYYREQYLAQKKQQEAMQKQYQQRPQMSAPQAANPQTQYIPKPQQRMPARPLYGSLHDDLKRNMTVVPRPRTAPDYPNNANAPLATSRALPTRPVMINPLQTPVIPGLVGG